MAQLIIEVDDETVKEYGLASLKDDFEKYLNFRRLSRFAKEYETALLDAGIDHDQLWKEAKSKAFAEYKEKYLKDIIP
jgi:hypothetical protein